MDSDEEQPRDDPQDEGSTRKRVVSLYKVFFEVVADGLMSQRTYTRATNSSDSREIIDLLMDDDDDDDEDLPLVRPPLFSARSMLRVRG